MDGQTIRELELLAAAVTGSPSADGPRLAFANAVERSAFPGGRQ